MSTVLGQSAGGLVAILWAWAVPPPGYEPADAGHIDLVFCHAGGMWNTGWPMEEVWDKNWRAMVFPFDLPPLGRPDRVFRLSLTLTLVGMNGPVDGAFALYQTDGFGLPLVRLATADGLTSADSHALIVGGHAHSNWVFNQPGIYELEFTFAGIHAIDGPKSAGGIFTFGVTQVPEPGCSGTRATAGRNNGV